jgi:hypothetical protein
MRADRPERADSESVWMPSALVPAPVERDGRAACGIGARSSRGREVAHGEAPALGQELEI